MFFTNHTLGRLGNPGDNNAPWYYTCFDDIVVPEKYTPALDNSLVAGAPYAHVRIDWGDFPNDTPRLCHVSPSEEKEYVGRVFLALHSERHHDLNDSILGNGQVLTVQHSGIIRCKKVDVSDPWSDGLPAHQMYFIETIPGVNLRLIQTTCDSEGIVHGAKYYITSQQYGLVEGRAGPPYIFDKYDRAIPEKWINVDGIIHAKRHN